MAAHSAGTRAIPPVPNDQPPPAWDQWLRDMAQSLNLISLWVGTHAGPGFQAGSGIAIDTGTTPPTISTAVPYLPLTGGTLTGPLVIQSDSSLFGGNFAISNTGAGATNPAKWFRISNTGTLEIVNNAFSAVIFQLSDTGNLTLTGPYLYAAASSGTVNSTGGPFFYLDSNTIVAHLGPGNLSFLVQNTSGSNVGGFTSDGWLLGLGGRRVAYNDGSYTQIRDGSDRTAIQLGGTVDPQNYYRNGAHRFQGVAGATYDYTIDAGGITLQNNTAFRGRKVDGSLVNLAYVGPGNTMQIGTGAGMNCYVGGGGAFFDPNGGFFPASNILLPNNIYVYAYNTVSTPYALIGVTSSNRLNINPNGLGVDAGGAWSHSGTINLQDGVGMYG